MAQGALATLFGAAVASDTVTVSATTWPKTAANRQLVVNDDLQAPIYYIGPTQVNFQVPSNAPLGGRAASPCAYGGYRGAGGGRDLPRVVRRARHLHRERSQGTGQAAVLNQDFHGQFDLEPRPGRGRRSRFTPQDKGQVSPAVSRRDGGGEFAALQHDRRADLQAAPPV